MSHWNAPSRRSELATALMAVARKPLAKVFQKDDGSDQADFKILAEAAEELRPGDWKTRGFNAALREVILRATKAMSRDKGPYEHSRMSWGEIAATLYGFQNGDEADRVVAKNNHAYSRRYQVVKRRSFVESSTLWERVVAPTWPLLADALASLRPDVKDPCETGSRSGSVSGSTPQPDYVTRPSLEAKIVAALSRTKIVMLVGEGGTGKSTLARQLAMSSGNEHQTAFLDATSLDTLSRTLAKESDRLLGRSILTASAFCPILAGSCAAIKCAIIDNLSDPTILREILPTRSNVDILITSRREIPVRKCEIEYVNVGPMSAKEVHDLIGLRLPDATDEEVARLTVLRGRALAIDHVCAYLADRTPQQRTQFLEALQVSTVKVLDIAAVDIGERSLRRIYEQILDELMADPTTRSAVNLLAFMVALQGHFLPEVIYKTYFNDAIHARSADVLDIAFESAKTILKRSHLVAIVHFLTPHSRVGKMMAPLQHDLTFAILNEILGSRIAVIRRRSLVFMQKYRNELRATYDLDELSLFVEWFPDAREELQLGALKTAYSMVGVCVAHTCEELLIESEDPAILEIWESVTEGPWYDDFVYFFYPHNELTSEGYVPAGSSLIRR